MSIRAIDSEHLTTNRPVPSLVDERGLMSRRDM